jgi:hypothetical protein
MASVFDEQQIGYALEKFADFIKYSSLERRSLGGPRRQVRSSSTAFEPSKKSCKRTTSRRTSVNTT